jgi:plastocyanin
MASHTARPSARVNLGGVVRLLAMAGQQIDAQDMADTVVYFMPDAGAPHPQPGTYTIAMHHRMFHPSMLVIPLGSTVRFPNRDKYLHNVFSVTPGSQFDLGLQGYGQAGQHTFTRPGLVLINCNVHPSMQATVLVVASPYIARPAANGQFSLDGLPPGPGTLTVWQPRAGTLTRHIVLPLTTPLALRVVVTQPRLLPHARMSSVFPDAGMP